MPIVASSDGNLVIPNWVADLPTFRRWVESDEFPEEGRIEFINGQVFADVAMQQVYSHLRVKSEVNMCVGAIVKQENNGLFLPDGLRVFHECAGLSAVPDAAYLSFASIRSGRLKLIEGREGGFVAVEGGPDLVIEVVSDSSENKDTEWLMGAYWDAGVREYWVIDARSDPLHFDLYKRGAKGFSAMRKAAGWVKSAILQRSFRLVSTVNKLGHPDFALHVR